MTAKGESGMNQTNRMRNRKIILESIGNSPPPFLIQWQTHQSRTQIYERASRNSGTTWFPYLNPGQIFMQPGTSHYNMEIIVFAVILEITV